MRKDKLVFGFNIFADKICLASSGNPKILRNFFRLTVIMKLVKTNIDNMTICWNGEICEVHNVYVQLTISTYVRVQSLNYYVLVLAVFLFYCLKNNGFNMKYYISRIFFCSNFIIEYSKYKNTFHILADRGP